MLFLDDEPGIVRAGERLLENLGYRVSAFGSPEEALAAFRRAHQAYDLVLSDLTMPGLTGIEVAREVRRARNRLPASMRSSPALRDRRTRPNDPRGTACSRREPKRRP